MKKRLLIPLSLLAMLTLVGCATANNSASTNTGANTGADTGTGAETNTGSDYDYNEEITVEDPVDIEVEEVESEFDISTEDGEYSKDGNIYRITKAGTYVLEGKLEGQILIEAGDDDEVVLELNGVTISYDQDSPIKAVSGSKLEVSAKNDTDNVIKDNRSAKTTEIASQGEGAISADIDLKLKGAGTLVVTGNYNNGVHTSKDLTIQKLTLKSTGYNNAIKGKDSVTITSGTVQAYAVTGNGIKTDDSDLSSKGKQRGTITINGGTVYVDSLHDAIDASYNIVVDELDSEAPTEVSIKAGTYSSNYNRSTFKADSEKGLKAANEITINKGTVVVAASDDAVHANYGDALENGNKGLGNITVNDGLIQVASGDDGLHADNTLTVNGGKIVVTGATEGYEANYININGGYSYIYGTDDGVNCSKKSFNSCAFVMTDGYLDVAVKSGDTDGIDSNGNFTLSGGTIVTRGSPGTTGSGMSTGMDVDGTISMTGGTLIAFNGLEKSPTASSTVKYAGTSGANSSSGGFSGGGPGWRAYGNTSSSISLAAGNYTLSGTGLEVSFTNDYIYGSFQIYSSSLTTGSTYTLSRSGTAVLSWTQSSNSVTIS
ncbi:MAG: carbohydrate-binding domain-containing protein [Bacilli bacterium]|nr:carbohydrate-binding domain-containing protein [Bacilli bacterium]